MFLTSNRPSCGEGCQNGVAMDDDTYFEGWELDVVYPPCTCHPKHCKTCGGSGWCPQDIQHDSDDCPTCGGDGWIGEPEHPAPQEAHPNEG